MSQTVEGLYYSQTHEWVKVEGDEALVGITDYAQHALGSIVYVDMPEEDDELAAGGDFGAVESVKAASDLIAPVSGTVLSVNGDLEDSPALLNSDPFGTWIVRVKLSDASELELLMTASEYTAFCDSLK